MTDFQPAVPAAGSSRPGDEAPTDRAAQPGGPTSAGPYADAAQPAGATRATETAWSTDTARPDDAARPADAAHPAETELARDAAAAAGGDPFRPWGVDFTPVSTNLIKVRLLNIGIWLGIPMLGLVVLGIFVTEYTGWWIWIFPGVLAALLLWLLWLVPRQVRALGYAELEEDLIIRKGVMFKNLVVVPYGRMQYVDVNAGPVDRAFGVSAVQLHTASAATDANLPGLPPAEAARLRDRLATLGEARLAGL